MILSILAFRFGGVMVGFVFNGVPNNWLVNILADPVVA
jgi:hypothetical protein